MKWDTNETFVEDEKEKIRRRKSRKDRQYNGQLKQWPTNNYKERQTIQWPTKTMTHK